MSRVAHALQVGIPLSTPGQIYNAYTEMILAKVQSSISSGIPRRRGVEQELTKRPAVVVVVVPLFLGLQHEHRERPRRRRLQAGVERLKSSQKHVGIETAFADLKTLVVIWRACLSVMQTENVAV